MALTRKQADAIMKRLGGARKPTRKDLLAFIAWAVERAKEEEGHAQGDVRNFLVALGDDGEAILRRAGAAPLSAPSTPTHTSGSEGQG